ncbi:hypothetical protein D3C74_481060 [compost metagenome]
MTSACAYAVNGPRTWEPPNIEASSETVIFSAASCEEMVAQVAAPASSSTRPAIIVTRPMRRTDRAGPAVLVLMV